MMMRTFKILELFLSSKNFLMILGFSSGSLVQTPGSRLSQEIPIGIASIIKKLFDDGRVGKRKLLPDGSHLAVPAELASQMGERDYRDRGPLPQLSQGIVHSDRRSSFTSTTSSPYYSLPSHNCSTSSQLRSVTKHGEVVTKQDEVRVLCS